MTSRDVEQQWGRAGFSVRMVALVGLACVLGACDGGMSTQDAAALCDIEKQNKLTVIGDAYQECIACYEQCGDDCRPQGTNPETYACEE